MNYRDDFAAALEKMAQAEVEYTRLKEENARLKEQSIVQYSEVLEKLGVDDEEGAIVAIQEAQEHILELSEELTRRDKMLDSLQDQIVEQHQAMDDYVDMGASDQMFYLTEFVQDNFPHDFNNDAPDIIVMAKQLLSELRERRMGQYLPTKKKFLEATKAVLEPRLEMAEEPVLWREIRVEVGKKLGISDLDDLFIKYVLGSKEIKTVSTDGGWALDLEKS